MGKGQTDHLLIHTIAATLWPCGHSPSLRLSPCGPSRFRPSRARSASRSAASWSTNSTWRRPFSRTGTPTCCGRAVLLAITTGRRGSEIPGDPLGSMTYGGVPGLAWVNGLVLMRRSPADLEVTVALRRVAPDVDSTRSCFRPFAVTR